MFQISNPIQTLLTILDQQFQTWLFGGYVITMFGGCFVSFMHHYLTFLSASLVLTSVSGVIDGFVCLDEDVSGVKGHHQDPLLRVYVMKVHLQIHIIVLLLFPVQIIQRKLGSN